jgi:DNA-binding MarR family transcriptional regulator
MTRISDQSTGDQSRQAGTAGQDDAGPSSGELASGFSWLASVSRRLMKQRLAAEEWVAEAGLRPPCFGVLACIRRLEPASQKQISDRLGLDPSDMVAVVDILERAGFVSRVRDPDDRRRYALTVTPAGLGALRRLEALAAAVHDELLSPLDDVSRATFERLVQQIVLHHASMPAGPSPAEPA